MLTPCTACGCCWDDDGYYHYKGEIQQPCRVCRCDTSSQYYLNNHTEIRERQNAAYHADIEAKRKYQREWKRQRRGQAIAQMSNLS